MSNAIPLPPLPVPETWDKRYTAEQLRARDQEIVRCVLEAAARAAENWYAGGLEDEIARDIRALEFHHE